ncbi:hypothetical protein GGI10_001743 [Coemansia sp. RSA 2530]|nr:hypothetical protein GGI10_001743 [Coemansia sp. RSA 2530]
MSSSVAGEDVAVKAKPKYRLPRKNKGKAKPEALETGTGAESSLPQKQVKAEAAGMPLSASAPPSIPRAKSARGAEIISAKLSQAQAAWQDHWAPYNYAKNELKTKHAQLIVLDLNGTLIKRSSRNPDKTRTGYARPHLSSFLKFLLDNFAVMIWSSAQPFSVNNMLQVFMKQQQSRFVRVWDRRFCGLDGPYYGKAQTTKDLLKITNGYSLADSPHKNVYETYKGYKGIAPEMKGHWTLENIVLVDDSETKAVRQKENHVHVSTFEDLRHDEELLKLHRYLEAYIANKEAYPNLVSYLKERPWIEFRDGASSEQPPASEQGQ